MRRRTLLSLASLVAVAPREQRPAYVTFAGVTPRPRRCSTQAKPLCTPAETRRDLSGFS